MDPQLRLNYPSKRLNALELLPEELRYSVP